MRRPSVRSIALALSLGLTQACASSPPVHFYTLSMEASGNQPLVNVAKDPRIMVGPVSIPDVVDRPQIVVRSGPNRVSLVDDHRWAEPLKSEVTRVIAKNIGRLVGSSRVWAHPENAGGSLDYRVLVAIQLFESTPGHDVVIDALWTVQALPQEGSPPKTGRSRVEESISGQGYEAVVAAHSRAIGVVSRDISEAIRSFVKAP